MATCAKVSGRERALRGPGEAPGRPWTRFLEMSRWMVQPPGGAPPAPAWPPPAQTEGALCGPQLSPSP